MTTASKQIVISVDTEEEGLWGGEYRATGNTTENLRGLVRFQQQCERLNVPPTYLIDAPVVENAQAMRQLSRWRTAGMCEIGAHCHPWCNPPLDPRAATSKETYLCRLPQEVQQQKLAWLTQRIADAVGESPTSYRAGRYGFDRASAQILADLGYRVDSSVLPVHDYRSHGGPDFRMALREPSLIFSRDEQRQLLEIPITVGFTRVGFDRRLKLWCRLRMRPWQRFRLAGMADRAGIARRVKLSPEGSNSTDLRALVDSCISEEISTLVLMLHSSSLAVGYSPYATNAEQLEQFYKRFIDVVAYASEAGGYQPVTLTDAAENVMAAVAGKLPVTRLHN